MQKSRALLSCALLGLVASVVMTPSLAVAQSLKSIRAQQAEEAALNDQAAFTNSVCGGDLSASIAWASAADWPENESLAGACDGALGALEAICRTSGGKEKASKVKSFVCKGDGSGPSLSGGALEYGATPGGNGFAETKTYLDGAL